MLNYKPAIRSAIPIPLVKSHTSSFQKRWDHLSLTACQPWCHGVISWTSIFLFIWYRSTRRDLLFLYMYIQTSVLRLSIIVTHIPHGHVHYYLHIIYYKITCAGPLYSIFPHLKSPCHSNKIRPLQQTRHVGSLLTAEVHMLHQQFCTCYALWVRMYSFLGIMGHLLHGTQPQHNHGTVVQEVLRQLAVTNRNSLCGFNGQCLLQVHPS